MSGHVRIWSTAVIAATVAVSLAGCGTSKVKSHGTLGTPSLVAASSPAGTPPSSPAASPSATPTPTPTVAPAKALTCNQIKFAEVGSKTISYNGYHDSIPLGGGLWSGEDGNTVTLVAPCAIGDLTGDGAKDALGVVSRTNGGSGDFFTLILWRNKDHSPQFWALNDLGDRNPVAAISISGQVATVTICTRTDDVPMAQLNVTRTATYKLSGHNLAETGHTDVESDCTPAG